MPIHRILSGWLTAILLTTGVYADEGLWLPTQIQSVLSERLRQAGCLLEPEDIYSINRASLKDAVLSIGGFCTGSLISGDGLVLTNHHCVSDLLTDHSTEAHNYYRDGFWARHYREELPNEYLWARRLIRIEDVTNAFSAVQQYPEGLGKRLATSLVADSVVRAELPKWEERLAIKGLKGQVRPFFNGRQYLLMIYQEFQDVRLVGAPPLSIGKFGGNQDNWMWPRHAGDFAFLRLYVDTSGYPAEYSPENIPYRSSYFLPISLKGLAEHDFTMVMGFPGKTNRYAPPHEVALLQYCVNPAYIPITREIVEALEAAMEASPQDALDLADRYAKASNFHKYTVGQQEGFFRYHILDAKMKEAARLSGWVRRHAPYKSWVFDSLGSAIHYAAPVAVEYHFLSWFFSQPLLRPLMREIIRPAVEGENIEDFAWKAVFRELQNDYESIARPSLEIQILGRGLAHLWNTHRHRPDLDSIMRELSHRYALPYPAAQAVFPSEKQFQKIFFRYLGEEIAHRPPSYVTLSLKEMMGHSSVFMMSSTALARKWTRNPHAALREDDFLSFLYDLYGFYVEQIRPRYAKSQQLLNKLSAHYRDLYFSMEKIDTLYPDANGTLRFSYGHIAGYTPADAVHYRWYSTHYGLLEKHRPDAPDYRLPVGFIDFLQHEDFGRYGIDSRTLPLCFITTNDISGGNSGSPVLDGQGHLVGVAFDSNWEGVVSDLYYIPATSRTIVVDVHYVLWFVQRVARNHHILRAVRIVKG